MGDVPFTIPVTADPDMPPGVAELRAGQNRVRFISDAEARAIAENMRRRAETDPEFAEDVKSLLESKDYFTYPGGATPPIRCECCGTPVSLVPEVQAYRRGEPKPAIWEPGPWRKHTLRRCEAIRSAAVNGG